jgi:hypothetical protein
MEETTKSRHKKLMEFLQNTQRYKKVAAVQDKSVISEDVHKIDPQKVDAVTILIIDFLHLYGGSIGDIDLYKLIHEYLLNPDSRAAINKAVNDSYRKRIGIKD